VKTCGTCVSFKRLESDPKWGECGYKLLIPDAAEYAIDPGFRNVREDDGVACPCWARKSDNPAESLRHLIKSDPQSLEAIGQRLGATSPVKLDEASFDEAARALERPALRCHVCGAPTEKTYTFERTYENKAYEARTMRFSGLPLCDGCVPRTQDEEGT